MSCPHGCETARECTHGVAMAFARDPRDEQLAAAQAEAERLRGELARATALHDDMTREAARMMRQAMKAEDERDAARADLALADQERVAANERAASWETVTSV